ncbi:GNAT family N-acetyltransferase [Halobacterium wangiae]|uniref:GNAT family N-acetyltransferase n=1 Tax=Halobacterium wangiae TaxID=2902623 RepID=UPI001E2BA399|nr:GNAT family N-acetyltransferase [Halobacterium wangiae]
MATTRELTDEADRRDAVPLLRQLWTDRDPEDVLGWTGDDEYRLFGRYVDDELVAVAGVQVQSLLHHRRGAWLLDLVVDDPRRGEGHGAEMLAFVESWAGERDCEYVALASPLGKDGVHEFYDDQNYEQWGYVVETDL